MVWLSPKKDDPMNDLPLLDRIEREASEVRTNQTDTSKAAAESLDGFAGIMSRRIWEHVEDCGQHGATSYEIGEALNLGPQSVSGRVNVLINRGLLYDTGERREGGSGRLCRVYKTCQREATENISRYVLGGRDALLGLREWMVKENELRGGWWLGGIDCGRDVLAKIEQLVKEVGHE